jgi:thymidylate synthase (FAD)
MMEERRMYKTYDEIVNVRLVSYSQPGPEFLNLLDPEETNTLTNLISFCARVSNPSNQNNTETSEKLLNYLIKNKHWSPFEMATVCLEITSTRDIVRQILRHKAFFQEYSQRYADPTQDLEFCLRECRLQDTKNRQNSITLDEDKYGLSEIWKQMQTEIIEKAKMHYQYAVSQGIAKEVARVILPEGNTVSRLYMNASLRTWIHFLEVRTGNGTQKEHMMVARACTEAINKIFPHIK